MARQRTDICPRCKKRKKDPRYSGYCTECGRLLGRIYRNGERTCPICGKPAAPHKHYCADCSALPQLERRSRALDAESRHRAAAARRRKNMALDFAEPQREAAEINWNYVRGCGIVSKRDETRPSERPPMTVRDFISDDGLTFL